MEFISYYLVRRKDRLRDIDQMSRDEIIILTYSCPLRVNVRVFAYLIQVKVQLALERVYQVCK